MGFFVQFSYTPPDRKALQKGIAYITHREERLSGGGTRTLYGIGERYKGLRGDESAIVAHLWDDRRTDIAIVFVGGGDCYRVLKREPMLSSRVYVWQEFRRMTPEQVLDVIPVYHPVWAEADAELLAYTDAHAGHGNFRAWSKITAHVVTGLGRLDRSRPDREVLQWVFSRIGGRAD